MKKIMENQLTQPELDLLAVYEDILHISPGKQLSCWSESQQAYRLRPSASIAAAEERLEDALEIMGVSRRRLNGDSEYDYSGHIREAFCEGLRQRQEKMVSSPPVYRESVTYADAHDEMEQYCVSLEMNMACARAIGYSIADHYADNCLDAKAVMDDVAGEYGFDRLFWVLANTAYQMRWDMRITSQNKSWAEQVPLPGEADRNTCRYIAEKPHIGLVDMVLTHARQIYQGEPLGDMILEAAQEQAREAEHQEESRNTLTM